VGELIPDEDKLKLISHSIEGEADLIPYEDELKL